VRAPEIESPQPERWFDTTAFAYSAPGTFGNSGRNIVTGPDYQNVNAALIKQMRISRARVDLRLESFNLFNRTNFDQPDNFLGSPTFGQVLSAQSPRRVQIGARVVF
jgi:hypothetical protein